MTTRETVTRYYELLSHNGDRASALVRYEVRPPNGNAPFESHVAELFAVKNERIGAFSICFDTAPYPKT